MKKIVIVEDMSITALNMARVLKKENYEVVGNYISAEEATNAKELYQADLFLIDISLKGDKDGIWLADIIRKNIHAPIVFITGQADNLTRRKAMQVEPDGYLNKPFTESELISAVEIALNKFNKNNPLGNQSDILVCKNGKNIERIPIHNICYIKSDGNYLNIFTYEKRYYIRGSIKDYLTKLTENKFIQTHKSYLVSLDKVEKVTPKKVYLRGNIEIPISRRIRKDIVSLGMFIHE